MRAAFLPGTSRHTWHCSVLDPCWLLATGHAVYLRKLPVVPVSPRSTRAPNRSSASSWPASCWSSAAVGVSAGQRPGSGVAPRPCGRVCRPVIGAGRLGASPLFPVGSRRFPTRCWIRADPWAIMVCISWRGGRGHGCRSCKLSTTTLSSPARRNRRLSLLRKFEPCTCHHRLSGVPSAPGVFAPWLPATRANATISVAGSCTKLNRSSNRRPGSAAAQR
jgi:hypothetical protein